MTRRLVLIGAAVVGLATAAGCGNDHSVTVEPRNEPPAAKPASSNGVLVLAQFDDGVGLVGQRSSERIWTEPKAVAALDGSAVFSIRHDGSEKLVRVNPRTGALLSSWPLRTGLSISAVAPEGRWVALTDHAGYAKRPAKTSTELVVFDPEAGSESHRLTLKGDLRPEAFSVDGKLLFALDNRGDHYRVQTIELATRDRYDTSDRDKTLPPEDMHGAAVRGVMSVDRTLLATLYRNPADGDEPAFVHVLDLEHGWSYCADLPPPFGTGPAGGDVIELSATNTVIVASTHASRVAEIHIANVHTPGNSPVPVEFRDGSITPQGAALRSLPGFEHVIAVLAA